MTKLPYTAQVCRLMLSTPVIHIITRVTTHLLTPKGWEAELAWLADLYWALYPYIRHRSGRVPQPEADVLTTEPRRRKQRAVNVANLQYRSHVVDGCS